jgi:hypothetical protein
MSYSLNVSMLEIYNEQVRDLLAGKKDGAAKLDIRATATGSEVPGLTSFEVHTPTEVHELMIKGNSARFASLHMMLIICLKPPPLSLSLFLPHLFFCVFLSLFLSFIVII